MLAFEPGKFGFLGLTAVFGRRECVFLTGLIMASTASLTAVWIC